MNENAVIFKSRAKQLVGIEHVPNTVQQTNKGVVIVVGGPQTRVGSHRLFVTLARTLAKSGVTVFRFDYTGAGDSEGEVTEFTHIQADIDAAIQCFSERNPHIQSLTLWGLCDAASAILLYLKQFPTPAIKIDKLILVNPWVRQTHTQAKTYLNSYYIKRLLSKAFWAKLFSGGVNSKTALTDIHGFYQQSQSVKSDDSTQYVTQMRKALESFSGPVTFVLSDNDLTADEFTVLAKTDKTWQAVLAKPTITQQVISSADHTFSNRSCKDSLISLSCKIIS